MLVLVYDTLINTHSFSCKIDFCSSKQHRWIVDINVGVYGDAEVADAHVLDVLLHHCVGSLRGLANSTS